MPTNRPTEFFYGVSKSNVDVDSGTPTTNHVSQRIRAQLWNETKRRDNILHSVVICWQNFVVLFCSSYRKYTFRSHDRARRLVPLAPGHEVRPKKKLMLVRPSKRGGKGRFRPARMITRDIPIENLRVIKARIEQNCLLCTEHGWGYCRKKKMKIIKPNIVAKNCDQYIKRIYQEGTRAR